MSYRVVVWSTGGIGSLAIGAIHERSDLELVGVWVHSKDKVGRDAGELANGTPIGLATTGDADELIALRPDCVVYAACGPERDAAAVPDYVKLLEAGINVVTTTTTDLVNPASFHAGWRQQLERAAEAGRASLFASGIHPGFALDQLVVTLTTQSKSIDAIHLYELGMYDDYAAEDTMTTVLGFGQPMTSDPMMAIPGIISTAFGGHIRFVADALGLTLSEVTEHFDSRPTERTLDVAHGRVEAGTRGAIRMRAAGVVDGREVIVLEHITRVGRDIAPEWPIGPGNVTYRVEIEGDPDLECTLVPSLKDPDGAGIPGMTSGGGAMMASAMRIVNAIPYVVEAAPGLLRSLDLPLTVPTAEVFGTAAGATTPA